MKARIEKIQPERIKVKLLEENRYGFIPKQELSWDESIHATPPVFELGKIIDVVELSGEEHESPSFFSVRRLTDPWENIERRYQVGKVVRGEVVHIRHFGAFVQVEPGIVAIIRPKNIPLCRDEVVSDVLARGDQVMGLVSHFDSAGRKMEISITQWLEELNEQYENQGNILLDIFEEEGKGRMEKNALFGAEAAAHGYWEGAPDEETEGLKGSFIRKLEMDALVRRPLDKILQQLLDGLRAEIEVKYLMIVDLDILNKQVSLLASSCRDGKAIPGFMFSELYYSPVRDVAEKREFLHAVNIRQDNDPRFRYFFRGLDFSECLGIPLAIPDIPANYALFLLNDEKRKFEPEEIMKIRTARDYIQLALERDLLLNFMRRYEKRFFAGELLGSLVHELKTMLTGLSAQSSRLSLSLQKAGRPDIAEDSRLENLDKAADAAERIAAIQEDMVGLTEAFSRLAKGDFEAVDLNVLVKKIKRQLDKRALEGSVKIHLALDETIPPARAIASRLEQVLANLILNGIQQIEGKAVALRELAEERGGQFPLLQSGWVVARTSYVEAKNSCRITVLDTGPGLHYEQREKIFQLGYSTRESGEGLGLYISRNLVDLMEGKLYIKDSVLFTGSSFAIEFPAFE